MEIELGLTRLLRIVFSDVSGISTSVSAMVEKELGERNFGFDSLKSRLKQDMEEKGLLPGIVSRRRPAVRGGASATGSAAGYKYIGSVLLHRRPGARDMEEAAEA